jgi:hypothetical protein
MFKNTRINGFVQKERVQAAYNMRGGGRARDRGNAEGQSAAAGQQGGTVINGR